MQKILSSQKEMMLKMDKFRKSFSVAVAASSFISYLLFGDLHLIFLFQQHDVVAKNSCQQ